MSLQSEFRRYWESSTADYNVRLYGFRRFKTSHLLNLRFLEAKAARLDRAIYQAGLSLNIAPSDYDRLGLRRSKRDQDVPDLDQTITEEVVTELRDVLREYDQALLSFKEIMAMDTYSPIDDDERQAEREDQTLYEMYKTRLVCVDQRLRHRQDPLQRWLHQLLRSLRYRRLSQWRSQGNKDVEAPGSPSKKNKRGYCWTLLLSSCQNSSRTAYILSRLIVAIVMAVFLTAPLAILSQQQALGAQMAVISVFLVAFSCVVSALLGTSNLEIMMATAAYAAVLSVFMGQQ